MALRVVGVDSDNPILPETVRQASIGTTAGTFADGGTVANVQAATESVASAVAANGMAVVNFGENIATPRPSGFAAVTWIGVEGFVPENAVDGDVIILREAVWNPLAGALAGFWADDPLWTPPTDGGDVETIRDVSGGTWQYTNAAGEDPSPPTFDAEVPSLAGHPAIFFDRQSHQRLQRTLAQSAPYKMVFVAQMQDTPNGAARIVNTVQATSSTGVGKPSSSVEWVLNGGTPVTGGEHDEQPHVFRATIDGASSGLWVDETQVISGDAGSTATDVIRVGGPNNLNSFEGWVSFFAIFDGSTSDGDLETLVGQLAEYYEITLA